MTPGGEGGEHVVVAEQAVRDGHHVGKIARIRADAAEDAEHSLDQERRLDQLAVREVRERVQVPDVVALELEARAERLADLAHDALDVDVVVVHDPAARAVDVRLLPRDAATGPRERPLR